MEEMTDWMEYGDSGWVALPDGWMQEISTGDKRAPDGRIVNRYGKVLWDPTTEDDEEEYER